jgi:hypothetical protein
MFVFVQDVEIRNWVKTLLTSTPKTPFTTAKKTWNKLFAIFFLKCILNLNTYPWKKNAQTWSLLPEIWGLKTWSRKCFPLQPGPTPRPHLCPPRKNGKKYSKFFFLKNVSIFKIYPSVHLDSMTPVRTFVCQQKLMKIFCKFLFAMHFGFKYQHMKKSMPKSNHYCPKYEGSKKGKKLPPPSLPSAP